MVDAIVVGAGLSGLRAASLLNRQGFSVLVFEASSRVGGRLKPFTDAEGVVWDVGRQWVGQQQRRVHTLLREYGVGTRPQYDDVQGKLVIVNSNVRHEAEEGVYPEAFATCLSELDRLAQELPQEGESLPA